MYCVWCDQNVPITPISVNPDRKTSLSQPRNRQMKRLQALMYLPHPIFSNDWLRQVWEIYTQTDRTDSISLTADKGGNIRILLRIYNMGPGQFRPIWCKFLSTVYFVLNHRKLGAVFARHCWLLSSLWSSYLVFLFYFRWQILVCWQSWTPFFTAI